MFLRKMGNNPKQKLLAKTQYSKKEKWMFKLQRSGTVEDLPNAEAKDQKSSDVTNMYFQL